MYYLACDIGASSGRHILGSLTTGGRMELQEIYRFENGYSEKNGRICWDMDALFRHVMEGLKLAKPYMPYSFGIDTWAVDFVLLDRQNHVIGDAVAYRDSRTQGMDAKLEETLSFGEHYALAGIAKQPFNTVYQFMSLPKEELEAAAGFLMVPDYLHFLLTGVKSNEYTNASSTAMLNSRTRDWDADILNAAGIPLDLFPQRPAMPGMELGAFLPQIEGDIGYPCKVVLPATHDTGSAFMAIPAKDENAVYLSSGTWSLLGIELPSPMTDENSLAAGFTNEGGYGGGVRYLKNIMGLWILQSIRKELGERYTFVEMADMAEENAGFTASFDANAPRFLAPSSMLGEIRAALKEAGGPLPQTDGEMFACAYHSLTKCYQDAVCQLSQITGKTYTSMNIVGGGSQNRALNQWTANALGIPVYAGPTEGAALGNIIAQMIAAGEFSDLQTARKAIEKSFEIETYLPKMKGARNDV